MSEHPDLDRLAGAISGKHISPARREEILLHLVICESCRTQFLRALEGFHARQQPRRRPPGEPLDFVAEPGAYLVTFQLDRWAPGGTVVKRLEKQPRGKIALCLALHGVLSAPSLRSVFLESGSTPAWALAGAIAGIKGNYFPPLPSRAGKPLGITTNNHLALPLLHSLPDVLPLHLNFSIYDRVFGGYFPVAEEEIQKAIEFVRQQEQEQKRVWTPSWSLQAVQRAWADLLGQALRFDVLVLTASHLHPYLGPTVSSQSNALVKAAAYCGRRLVILLDGSKLLSYQQMKEIWEKGEIQIFDRDRPRPAIEAWLHEVFEEPNPAEAARQRRCSISRHPVVNLQLTQTLVNTQEEDSVVSRVVKAPGSWADCVRDILASDGQVDLWVSQPDGSERPTFEATLQARLAEGNRCLERAGVEVRLAQPVRSEVRLDADSFPLLPTDLTTGQVVSVYRCAYRLRSVKRKPRRASRSKAVQG